MPGKSETFRLSESLCFCRNGQVKNTTVTRHKPDYQRKTKQTLWTSSQVIIKASLVNSTLNQKHEHLVFFFLL